MEDVQVTIVQQVRDVQVSVEQGQSAVEVVVSDPISDGGAQAVTQLRAELGDIHTDLALLFKIGMDL